MPEATASGITKANVKQAAVQPWRVHPVDSSGVSYTVSQVLTWLQAAVDRTGA